MSVEENKATVRRLFEEFWNANNPDVADELVHPDYPHGEAVSGLENFRTGRFLWLEILPDQQFILDEVVAEGDTVIVRWTSTGTHQGAWSTPIGIVDKMRINSI